MTDEERIDDAYERIDIDTDEILAFYDGERVELCVKSIWDATVTMHQIATVALKENAKLRKLCRDMFTTISWCNLEKREYIDRLRELGIELNDD